MLLHDDGQAFSAFPLPEVTWAPLPFFLRSADLRLRIGSHNPYCRLALSCGTQELAWVPCELGLVMPAKHKAFLEQAVQMTGASFTTSSYRRNTVSVHL